MWKCKKCGCANFRIAISGYVDVDFDEDEEEDYEYYYYINPNAPIALTYYPNYPDLIDNNLHKVPLSMFMEDKEFVREVIKDFFDKGNTEKVKENYIKNKWIMDKYK